MKARCTKGVFGKYCVLVQRETQMITYCGLYFRCDSENRVPESAFADVQSFVTRPSEE